MNNRTLHSSASLPPNSGPSSVDDSRTRAISDPSPQLIPEPFQSIPAQELLKDKCRHCGWIRKEGGNIKTWTDRYTIVHKGCIYYYYKPESTTTAGKFSLGGYRLSPAPEKSSKYQWTFKLVHLQPEKRTYYFAAYSEQEMNEWMQKISEDMIEYCGVDDKQNSPNKVEDLPEYSYPEVEPKIDALDLPAALRQCLLSAGPSLQSKKKPSSAELYCPPPDVIEPPPRPQPRQLPPLPPERPKPPTRIGLPLPGFSYTGGIGTAMVSRPVASSSASRPRSPSAPRRSPVAHHKESAPPVVPVRNTKPTPGIPLPRTPLVKPKPELRKQVTEPDMRPVMERLGARGPAAKPTEEEGDNYLALVPDTDPKDVQKPQKNLTLQRGKPDGRSFRHSPSDDVLPSSAERLDLDKSQVATLLRNRFGVYILRESQNAQSKRALSVWTGEKVSHYLIFYDRKLGFTLDPDKAPRFSTIEDLLRHYYRSSLPNTEVKLSMPYKGI